MADRYLLESGSPDGYQLEDGSGVLLLDDTTLEIVNNANTTVTYQGGGAYWVEKTSGAAAYDAGAVSNVGVAGDFVLRLLPIANTTDSMAGVNSDPLTDNTLSSIDFGFAFVGTTSASIYESGGFISTGNALSTYYWIWRTGTTLGYGTGADLTTAQASPFRTTISSATLYFDSALFTSGAKFEAYFYRPMPVLTASSGSFTLAGTAASLKSARKITAASASFTLTGTAATLRRGLRLTALSASYSLSGTAAALKLGRKLAAASGSFALAGTAASLKADRKLAANSGSFALGGTSVTLLRSYLMGAGSGSYDLTGTDADLIHAAASASYSLTALPGAFRISEGAAAMVTDRAYLRGRRRRRGFEIRRA
jgi:hypothetical protein